MRNRLTMHLIVITLLLSLACAVALAEPVEIEFWHHWGTGPEAEALDYFVQEFNRTHPHISVKGVYQPTQEQRRQKFQAAVAAGDPPDVYYETGVARFGFAGMLQDLTPFLERDLDLSLDDFIEGQISRQVWAGKLYGIPREADVNALFWWNKDTFSAAGLDPDQAPMHWDELKAYAQKLTLEEANRLTQIGFIPTYSEAWFYLWLWLAGGELYTTPTPDRPPTVTFNDEKGRSALSYMVELTDLLGGVNAVAGFEQGFQSGVNHPFYIGKLAMMISGNWEYGNLQYYRPDLNFGVTHCPIPRDGGKIATSSGGFSFTIPVGTRKSEQAWEFIKWMSSRENTMKWVEMVPGRFFARKDVLQSPVYQDDQYTAVMADILAQYAHGFPEDPWVGTMWQTVNVDMRDAAIYHKKTVQEALDEAAALVQEEINKVYEK